MRMIALWIMICWLLGSWACENREADCNQLLMLATKDGISATDSCVRTSTKLNPYVRINGVWRGGGNEGQCVAQPDRLSCPVENLGNVIVVISDTQLVPVFEATQSTTIEGFLLQGPASLPGAESWLSNGFQSWSSSGVVAIGPRPSEEELHQALVARGDEEVLRSGEKFSWWYSFVGGGELSLFAGVLTADRFKSWVQISQDEEEDLWLCLGSGSAGERIQVNAQTSISGESWLLNFGDNLNSLLEGYGYRLPARRRTVPQSPEAGWNSWYELWSTVDENAVFENAEISREIFKPLLPAGKRLRIVIDDGWQKDWGEWMPNEKFPKGLDGLASRLRDQGYDLGIWLAPLLVSADLPLISEHPDWFLPNTDYVHPENGRMRILDVTHPEAANHLREVIVRIVEWRFDLLKIDFLFAGSYEDTRFQPITGIQAYQLALQIIRDAAGEDVHLLAVGAPPLPTFSYVDSWRLGADIAFDRIGPSWHFAVNQARSLAARWPLCLAVLCDADPLILRKLDREEVEFGSWVVAWSGGALFLSDDLRELPTERRTWGLGKLQVITSLGGIPARPGDPYPDHAPGKLASPLADAIIGENNQVLPMIWILSTGQRVGINLSEEEVTLGSVIIPPHGARLLAQ